MRKASRLPAAFRSLKLLKGASIAAMGFALAAAAGGVIGHTFASAHFALASAPPTLFYGIVWGLLLRERSTIGKSKIRAGWIASLPLAMANSALATGILLLTAPLVPDPLANFVIGNVLGTTLGALCWIPALVATLVIFGIPIAWSQRLAAKGLAGEERGEGIVGLASAVIGALAAPLAVSLPQKNVPPSWGDLPSAGSWLVGGMSLSALLFGSAAAFLALHRASRRRQFVSAVEQGSITGYRIDAGAEGKVLVRIAGAGEGYRVADVEEEVAALDEAGEVVAPLERHHS